MPRILHQIADIEDAIIQPVAFQTIRQLANILDLPEDIGISLQRTWQESVKSGSSIDSNVKDDPSSFKYSKKLLIEFQEKPVEDRILATAVHRRENEAIFLDRKLGVAIYPITVGTQMEISITYRADSRAEAHRFRNDILQRFAEGRTDFFHELDYHYTIPYEQMQLLKDIHLLRESNAGYNEDFETWINNNISPRATNIATQIATQKKVAIREKQISPMGFFDFVGTPEAAQKDREGATMNVTFQYTLTYDQVQACVMSYPLTVHGQLIPERYYTKPNPSGHYSQDQNRRLRAPSLSRKVFDVIAGQTLNWRKLLFSTIKTPYFDDWHPDYRLPFTRAFIQAMVGIDENSPQSLFKLSDIEEFEMEPVIRDFLISESMYACDFKNSIFHCKLYEDYSPMDDDALRLTPELEFIATRALDPRKQYHVEIGFVWQLSSLTDAARDRLRNSGEAGIRILEWLQINVRGDVFVLIDDLPENSGQNSSGSGNGSGNGSGSGSGNGSGNGFNVKTPYIPDLVGGTLITNNDLNVVAEILEGRGPRRDLWFRKGALRTVGQYGIIARRRLSPAAIKDEMARWAKTHPRG